MEVVRLVEVTRGELVESVHRGVVVVVDVEGKIIAQAGDASCLTYIRSAAKPMQALPVIESGAAAHFDLNPEELALLTASHSGEDEHVRVGKRIMEKIGLPGQFLQCGTHPPLHAASARKLLEQKLEPTVFHCTCSGKHAGMLALAKYHNWPLHDYYLPEHPVQQEMLRCIADFAGLSPEEITIGIDGCGVPVFAMSLYRMALAYARLAVPDVFSEGRRSASLALREAMTAYPALVAGTGRPATDIMKATGRKLVVKDGTEGVFCISVPEKGWGIALKIEDGHPRALGPVIVEILNQLALLDKDENERLAAHARKKIKNYRGEVIGEIRPAVTLIKQ